MKILLTEDDLKMAEYLSAGLSEHGHSVDHVTDGREALSYCLYHDCDIAIVDRMMPSMDGLSVVKALRAAHKELPVLFLTAMSQVDEFVRLTLADIGPGIPETARKAVFEPFHRLDSSRSRPGSGLGLTLVRAIAERHGARITLSDNAPGLRVVVEFAFVEQAIHS